ncbi:amino acid adenylation domain-containing protein [Streptomyces coeruleofuscus]|uniref:Carrier domain-containing protein n=1 Tax=Streptomyces coeruleofuscus TaxID=66879 RepID=A0ABP5V6L9_9ACTN
MTADAVQARLTDLFRDVLGVTELGPHESFFDYGDSLLAARLIMRVRAEFGQNVPLPWLFEGRTAAALAERLTQAPEQPSGPGPIERVDARRPVPLSHAQERLWFLHLLDPSDPAYNEPLSYRVRGALDTAALRAAFQRVVDRHEPLRTQVAAGDDGETPVLLVRDHVACALDVRDLRAGYAEGGEPWLRETLRTTIRRPFDLTTAPLVRGHAFRIGDDEWALLFTLHHIVTDGWSNTVFLEELSAGYRQARGDGLAGDAEALPVRFSDYAAWERRTVGEDLERGLRFWEEELRGAPDAPALRTDLPRGDVLSTGGDAVLHDLDAATSARIADVARRCGVSTYSLTLAVFTLLMHRWTGEADVVVGTPVAGRHHPELERLIGFFVNTLPVRSGYDGQDTFAAHAARVEAAVRRASAYDHIPFDRIVNRVVGGGHSGYQPLAQVVFAYQNDFDRRLALDGLDVELAHVPNGSARFEMTLFMAVAPGGAMECELEYNTDLFTRDTAERFLDVYRTLLAGVLDDPHRPLSQYSLVSPAEHRRLAAWNETGVPFPDGACLHHLVEEQAARAPDAVAVVHGHTHLTYGALDARANRLARHLRTLGVGADAVVGICMDRSVDMVVGLLGILKAGAAYLPLDPTSPRHRLETISEDARSRWCLSLERHRDGVPDVAHRVFLDTDRETTDAHDPTSPGAPVHPDDLVSVYYTSGSTGRPKGVANTHRGWVNRMAFLQRQHRLHPGETVLHKTTLSFDDAALEIFWPLLHGGRIALIDPELHRDPREIVDAAIRSRTIHLQLVPSMLAMVVDTVDALDPDTRALLTALRTTVSSGEALSGELVRRHGESLPGTLHNTWGATEVSIDSTTHACTAVDIDTAGAVSVGLPFDNNQIHVLDAHHQEVPVGVVGDLYIGGVGLARGYLGDPARTAAAFVPSPYAPGERLYRTGDRGYRRPDGTLMFVGRTDHQVKIRGMRVELGEIDAVLTRHPDVTEALTVVQESASGIKRLVAYVVAAGAAQAPTPTALRRHVGDLLPDYMVPSFVLVLDSFPLTPNGKVDRRALPEPDRLRDHSDLEFVAPQGPVQENIARIWADLLGVDKVGALDNFFALGGHSLVATRLVSRVHQCFGVDLPLKDVFGSPTVEALAQDVERLLAERVAAMTEAEVRELFERLGG